MSNRSSNRACQPIDSAGVSASGSGDGYRDRRMSTSDRRIATRSQSCFLLDGKRGRIAGVRGGYSNETRSTTMSTTMAVEDVKRTLPELLDCLRRVTR